MKLTLSLHYEEELAFLVLQFEFETECFRRFLMFERKQPSAGNPVNRLLITARIFLTTTTRGKIWLSSKFYPVLCVEQQFLKINFASREIQKAIFL